MDQTELAEKQKCLVRRYVEVWRRFRRLPDRQSGFVDLEDDMSKGSGMLLCGLLVEAEASRVIIADVKDPKFYTAILTMSTARLPILRRRSYSRRGATSFMARGRHPFAG